MANRNFPRVAVSSFQFALETPGQDIQSSPVTGRVEVFGTGIAFWRGTVTFGPFEYKSELAVYREVAAFINGLGGHDHTFDLPWIEAGDQADRFPGDITIQDWTRASTEAEVQLSVSADVAQQRGLRNGDWITINNRLYQCTSPQVDSLVVVTPGKIEAAVGDAVNYANPTIRARRANPTTPQYSVDRDFIAAIRLDWQQADV